MAFVKELNPGESTGSMDAPVLSTIPSAIEGKPLFSRRRRFSPLGNLSLWGVGGENDGVGLADG